MLSNTQVLKVWIKLDPAWWLFRESDDLGPVSRRKERRISSCRSVHHTLPQESSMRGGSRTAPTRCVMVQRSPSNDAADRSSNHCGPPGGWTSLAGYARGSASPSRVSL